MEVKVHTGHPARAVVVPRSAGSETNGEKQVTNVRGQQRVGASAQDPSLPLPWTQNPFCLGMGLTFLPYGPRHETLTRATKSTYHHAFWSLLPDSVLD